MMGRAFLLLGLLAYSCFGWAQSQILPVSGTISNANGSVAFVLGQTLYQPFTDANGSVSPGLLLTAETFSILPVELTDFSAELLEGSVTLLWQTATEVNNDFFEVQRMKEDAPDHFEALGSVKGAGNSDVARTYRYTDRAANRGLNWYRLRQVDVDGTEAFSHVISIWLDQSVPTDLHVYPNPVGRNWLQFDGPWSDSESLEVRLTDLQGVIIYEGKLTGVTDVRGVRVPPSIPAGLYALRVSTAEQHWTQSVFVLGK